MKRTRVTGLIAILFGLYGFSLFFRGSDFCMTPFRESQTAITALAMTRGESPFLAYHVPVLGKPWAVPMEFPLFQKLVALLPGRSPYAVLWTGKLLSLAFWGVSLWVLHDLLRRISLGRRDRVWCLLLMAAAPIFLGYSTAFLIETLALLLCLAYLREFVRWKRDGGMWPLFLMLAWGILGFWVKPTTWAPFTGVVVLWELGDFLTDLHHREGFWHSIRQRLLSAAVVLVILVLGYLWVHYGDQVKSENPLAENLMSRNLSRWNYGSLEQKLSPGLWGVILGRAFLMTLGPLGVVLPLLWGTCLVFVFRGRLPARDGWTLLLSLAGFFSAPVVFTNLYYRHDYYLVATGVFLVFSAVYSLSRLQGLWPAKILQGGYALLFLSSLAMSAAYLGVKKGYLEPEQKAVVAALRELPEEGAVVLLGYGWSSHIPYEADRRALMLNIRNPNEERLDRVIRKNAGLQVAAVVLASEDYLDVARRFQQELGLELHASRSVWPGNLIFTREPLALADLPGETGILERIRRKVLAQNREGGLAFLHTVFRPGAEGEGLFELMVWRGNEIFYVSLSELRLYRVRNPLSGGEAGP